jgi:NAD(P)-dependent dehydrogenase (short-subunit alcohol dehydrogenase family)
MLHDQTGRVVMMTGHGGGLDVAIATGLADAGARLAVADRDPDRARLIARAASRSASEGSVALGLDPARPEQVRRGIGAVEQLTGRLDGLVVIVEQGRTAASTEGERGITLGEMIHLVRATERRMAVLGGGRIVVIAGGAPRDPAVAAITIGAVAEFVRSLATGPAAGIVSINALIVEQPGVAPVVPPVSDPRPTGPAGPLPSVEPVTGDPGPATVATLAADGPDPNDQPAVLPFRLSGRPPEASDDAALAPPAMPEDDLAAVVAATALFLSPAGAAITGQVLRVTIPPRS